MRSKSWASNLAIALLAVMAIGVVTGVRVQTQAPFIVFGSNSGVSQPIKSTSNALWVSLQSMAAAFSLCWSGRACISSPADGQVNITNNANSAGVGFDVTVDGTLAVRNRAQNNYGLVNASTFGAGGGSDAIGATANKLTQINDAGNTTGLELNGGTPTLGTCTGGSMVSGSHNTAGEVTGNTSGSCVISFGTPNFTNTPFCFVNDETQLIAARISARSASSITVTGVGSGDAFQFFCIGRIGT